MQNFQVSKDGDRTVISVEGHLIVGNRQDLMAVAMKEMSGGAKSLTLDFAKARYIDSSGLSVMVSMQRKLKLVDGSLELRNLNEDLRDLMRGTKLDTVFTIVE